MTVLVRAKTLTPTQAMESEAAVALLEMDDRQKMLNLARAVERAKENLEKLEVTDDRTAGLANDYLAGAKMAYNELEKRRVEMKAPILEEGRSIDGIFNPAKDAFNALAKVGQKKVGDFIRRKQAQKAAELAEIERKKREAERKQQEAIRAAQQAKTEQESAAAEAVIRSAGQELTVLSEKNVDIPNGVQSDFATSTMRYARVVTITDIKLIPRELLEQAVLAEAEAATKQERRPIINRILLDLKVDEVPGAAFSEDPKLRTRVGMR